ncbi:MAG: hypothetical protein N2449_02345 [Bacteroidales bacterium]|nr:hypothetical protein [Bacteroidales bacterium]
MKTRFIFLCLILSVSCKKESSSPKPFDYSYFPLQVGQENIYKITKISIDAPSNVYDTQKFYLKEKIESYYYDEIGNKVYRIERYKRNDTLSDWIISDVWMSQYVNNQAHKVEENIRYVKLVFPLSLNLKWDGNAYNTNSAQIYTVTELDTPWNIFNQTCLIIQQNQESLIDKYYKSERFAKHIGLVEKKIINITQAYIVSGLPIEQRIKRGEIYLQTIVN